MATFLVHKIKWDLSVVELLTPNCPGRTVAAELPSFTIVWLPEFVACEDPNDNTEAVLDKVADDFGFCVLDCEIFTIEAEDAEDTSNHPCRARPSQQQ